MKAAWKVAMMNGSQAAHGLDKLKQLCAAAKAHTEEPLLQLDGLLPIRDMLLDAPIGESEFASEKERLKSGPPRWKSLLDSKALHQLEGACPGAKQLIAWRKACVGYFLAE